MRLIVQFLLASNFRRLIHTDSDTVLAVKVKDAFCHWEKKFKHENISEADNSIRNIMCHVLGLHKLNDVEMRFDDHLTDDQRSQLEKLCQCRLARMPVQYIIKEWDFRDLTLKMVPPVFIPRPETEGLIDIIVENSPEPPGKFLEVGCGSGAISLALLKTLPKATAIAIDQSKYACNLTKENSVLLGLSKRISVIQSKLDKDGTFTDKQDFNDVDMIVSNPPYVPTLDLHSLQPEIKLFEDMRALDGGNNGMKVIVPLMILASKILKRGGDLFMETDQKHPDMIRDWIKENNQYALKFVNKFKDCYDKLRFVHVRKEG